MAATAERDDEQWSARLEAKARPPQLQKLSWRMARTPQKALPDEERPMASLWWRMQPCNLGGAVRRRLAQSKRATTASRLTW